MLGSTLDQGWTKSRLPGRIIPALIQVRIRPLQRVLKISHFTDRIGVANCDVDTEPDNWTKCGQKCCDLFHFQSNQAICNAKKVNELQQTVFEKSANSFKLAWQTVLRFLEILSFYIRGEWKFKTVRGLKHEWHCFYGKILIVFSIPILFE